MKRVELKDVSKSYDGKTKVIKEINVDINQGEFFVLVGPSGCGKSTMLRMIAGLEEVSNGSLYIGEELANKLAPSQRNLSMVFQNYALYPHLSVQQNITFGLHTKKISKQEQKKRCLEAAEMLGLSELLSRKPRQLSGGQRQRVALARAIVTHAPICLMDEPLSNLDAKLRAKMRSEIRQIQRKLGITMIYVTHDQTEAMTMADRMMILHNGEVQQIGKPLEIYNQPVNTFVASFIGSPPMNLADCIVEADAIKVDDNRSILLNKHVTNLFHKGDEVTLGVRPEHIQIAKNGNMSFFADVVNVEVLGTETLITFGVGNGQWIAKWHGQWNIDIGERVPLYIDENDIYLFEKDSGVCRWHQQKKEQQSTLKEAIL
ncbi:ABC transporter ATP-binding protein [Metabacillus malikii]|uniref:Sn-glycerol 3-phosphate transport system ATP-binding protein n=1 Tax=Metabacillus malikii TaxID=1504265 RepID=A0ABT9ZDQ5_9BACI|nr:sn-glycerol-3-phosphate ABC transporter ATP-binding protein UgpC [Metabacillus malikii]MDQ0230394.1 sn-glycerol 3-phosphate transport system ATP-binding protein [Metabacillus malikii]